MLSKKITDGAHASALMNSTASSCLADLGGGDVGLQREQQQGHVDLGRAGRRWKAPDPPPQIFPPHSGPGILAVQTEDGPSAPQAGAGERARPARRPPPRGEGCPERGGRVEVWPPPANPSVVLGLPCPGAPRGDGFRAAGGSGRGGFGPNSKHGGREGWQRPAHYHIARRQASHCPRVIRVC